MRRKEREGIEQDRGKEPYLAFGWQIIPWKERSVRSLSFLFRPTTLTQTMSAMYQPQGQGEVAQPLQAAQATQYIHQYYQAPYNAAPATPIVAPGALSYYAFQPSANGQKPSEIVPSPAEPTVTPDLAQKAIRKLVTMELKSAGFEKAEPMTLKHLEYEVQACKSGGSCRIRSTVDYAGSSRATTL